MTNELQADDNVRGGGSFEVAPFVRRSTRVASKPPQQITTQVTTSGPRRNPKRKASEAASELNHRLNSDQLLDEALAPLSLKDVQEWEGWVELESEPAFFNIILRDLGVCNVKAQEIFTIDQDSLALLPQPVYGLVFLFQYLPGLEEETEEPDATGVWFANQTTSNACATVAMLNIVMNVEGIDLGEKLRAFKESTKDLNRVPDTGDWTCVARPQIEGRMLQYEESQLSFNLLALCQSPLTAYSQIIAHAAASLQYLHKNTESLPAFKDLISAEKPPLDIEDKLRLFDFNLTKADIMRAHVPDALQKKIKRSSFDSQSAYELHQELVVDVKAAMGEYRSELMAISDDEQRVKGRKKDYGPALHKWMKKLAEKGVLEEQYFAHLFAA
ncbi:hypothetical protein FPRO06_06957 [Fusarium proliferatum]|nr:hypothetical protein FPRO06_06957 [Fusarium proliferatum]